MHAYIHTYVHTYIHTFIHTPRPTQPSIAAGKAELVPSFEPRVSLPSLPPHRCQGRKT